MQGSPRHVEHPWRVLDPRRSLRARLALTFGLLVILLTLGLVVLLELTTTTEGASPAALLNELQRQIWVSGLVMTILFIGAAWMIAGRIAGPMNLIAEVARRQLDNGWEQVIPTFPGQDEVASLSRSVNILVARLKAEEKALREANELLEQRVAERTRQLTTLYDVLALSVEKDTLHALLDRALERILLTSRARAGCIHLISPNGSRLALVSQHQLSQPLAAACGLLSLDHLFVQESLRQPDCLLLDAEQAAAIEPALSGLLDGHHVLGVPVRSGQQQLGMLTVFAGDRDSLDTEERTLLASLADQLGMLIENDRLRQQAEQLAKLEERNRVARELHDSVTQALYSATLFAEAGQKQARAGDMEKALSYLDELLDASRQALKEMRLLIYKLRSSSLEKEGLAHALDQRLKAVEGRAGIETGLVVRGDASLPTIIEDNLYSIAVEALNNSLKHAHATAVSVTLAQTEASVTLKIADNGQGFDMDTAAASGGLGLTSMRERAALLNGTVTVASTSHGTTVTAVLPVNHPVTDGTSRRRDDEP